MLEFADSSDTLQQQHRPGCHATFARHSRAGVGIALQESHDGGVALGALNELLHREFAVEILVHLAEDLVGAFLRRRLVVRHLHDGPHHLVDRLREKVNNTGNVFVTSLHSGDLFEQLSASCGQLVLFRLSFNDSLKYCTRTICGRLFARVRYDYEMR